MTRTIGTALGETEKAENLATDVQEQLAAVTKDHPEFKGTTFAYGLALAPGSTDVGLYVDYDAVEYKINLLAPAAGDHLEAIGSVLKAGRTLAVRQLEVHGVRSDGARKLVANGRQTLIRVSRPVE